MLADDGMGVLHVKCFVSGLYWHEVLEFRHWRDPHGGYKLIAQKEGLLHNACQGCRLLSNHKKWLDLCPLGNMEI